MLGLGLQATQNNQGSGQIHPVQDGLVLADNFRLSPVNDNLGLEFPAEGSAVFNGTSDYVQLPDPFNYTNHTIAFWIYPAGTPVNFYCLFDNRDGAGDGISTNYSSANKIDYRVNGSTLLSTSTISASQWSFVVMQYDGTTMKIYIDGSLDGSTAASQTLNVTTNAVIGRVAYTSALYYKGNLANVAIWNRALSSDEINSVMWKNYSQVTNSERVGLQAWYGLSSYYTDWAAYATSQGATIEGETCANNALNALDLL